LDATAAAGAGKFFGQTFQPTFKQLSSSVDNWMSAWQTPSFTGVGAVPY
jgi:hypothetical protein